MLKESIMESGKAHSIDFAERLINAGFTREESIPLMGGIIQLFERENGVKIDPFFKGYMTNAFLDTFDK